MPSTVLDAYEFFFSDGVGGPGATMLRNVVCNAANTQTGGTRIIAEGTHVDQSVNTGSLILPRIIEASSSLFIINDSANALNLFAATASGSAIADTINSLTNSQSFSIPSGASCLVVRSGVPRAGRGVNPTNPYNWRATILT